MGLRAATLFVTALVVPGAALAAAPATEVAPAEIQQPTKESPKANPDSNPDPEAEPDLQANSGPATSPESDPSSDSELTPEPRPDSDQPDSDHPDSDQPDSDDPDLSHYLDSDEPAAGLGRVRIATADTSGVDHRERLRSHYAATYRPAHNPARLWFAARGSLAMAGVDTTGGGRMGSLSAEIGQTWNKFGYGVGPTLLAGGLSFRDGDDSDARRYSPLLVGGGPSLSLGRLALVGRGYVDVRVGYNFFYADVRGDGDALDPADAAPHGPKVQVDMGLLLHGSERRRFRHGLGASVGWQMLVHSLAGPYPRVNSFSVGLSYFFG